MLAIVGFVFLLYAAYRVADFVHLHFFRMTDYKKVLWFFFSPRFRC